MLGKMDKSDKKRTDFKGKKSSKKFKMAGKPKSGPNKPEQGAKKAKHFEKGDNSNEDRDNKMIIKIEKNKQMMKKKKELKQTTKDGGQKRPVKERGQHPAGEEGDRKAQWKKGKPEGKKTWKKSPVTAGKAGKVMGFLSGGYSDLSWTGVCCSSLITPTHLEGWFWQKRVPIFKDFSWKIGPFCKNFTIFGVLAMRKPESLGSVRNVDPCLKIFW